jgi:hypothetical protein
LEVPNGIPIVSEDTQIEREKYKANTEEDLEKLYKQQLETEALEEDLLGLQEDENLKILIPVKEKEEDSDSEEEEYEGNNNWKNRLRPRKSNKKKVTFNSTNTNANSDDIPPQV